MLMVRMLGTTGLFVQNCIPLSFHALDPCLAAGTDPVSMRMHTHVTHSSGDRHSKYANAHTCDTYHVTSHVQSWVMKTVSVGRRSRAVLPGCWKG